MSVTVRNMQRQLRVDCDLLKRQVECARNVFDAGKYENHSATIRLIDNTRMKVLNARYALKKYPTDVLSFRLGDESPGERITSKKSLRDDFDATLNVLLRNAPYLDMGTKKIIDPRTQHETPESTKPVIPKDLGTIFLSVEYCHRIAKKLGMRRHDYTLLATVHGLAHLVGYVHNTSASYRAMKRAEEEAMAVLYKRFPTSENVEDINQSCTNKASVGMPLSYLA